MFLPKNGSSQAKFIPIPIIGDLYLMYTEYKYETYKKVWYILDGETLHYSNGVLRSFKHELLPENIFYHLLGVLNKEYNTEPEGPDELEASMYTIHSIESTLFLCEKLNPFYLGEENKMREIKNMFPTILEKLYGCSTTLVINGKPVITGSLGTVGIHYCYIFSKNMGFRIELNMDYIDSLIISNKKELTVNFNGDF